MDIPKPRLVGTKCDARFTDRWSAAEAAAGGQCPTSGDGAAVQGFIGQHTDDVAVAMAGGALPDCPVNLATCDTDLAGCAADLTLCQAAPQGRRLRTGQTTCYDDTGTVSACGVAGTAGQDGDLQRGLPRAYVDNGDGTITDQATGLMWERLSADGSVHDMDGGFDFAHAFTTKAALLNAVAFAGYSDWRVPNRDELESLVDLGRAVPAIDAAFDSGCSPGCTIATCSCTGSIGYWSSTSDHAAPFAAWVVDFQYGDVERAPKTDAGGVRLVRGGS